MVITIYNKNPNYSLNKTNTTLMKNWW